MPPYSSLQPSNGPEGRFACGQVLSSLWKVNVVDIENTLKVVCGQVRNNHCTCSPSELNPAKLFVRTLCDAHSNECGISDPDLCWQVLQEPGVSKQVLKERAKALKKLGAIFEVPVFQRLHFISQCCNRQCSTMPSSASQLKSAGSDYCCWSQKDPRTHATEEQ